MENQNPLYDFLKANGLTQKTESEFLKEYSDPRKAKELYQFFQANHLTDKDEASFYGAYFKPKDKLPIKEFAAKIKAKYPDYKDMNDEELTRKVIAKYPEYAESVDTDPFKEFGGKQNSNDPFKEFGGAELKKSSFARDLGAAFGKAAPGGGQHTSAIKANLTPEQKGQLDKNIRAMIANGADENDVMAYANDYSNFIKNKSSGNAGKLGAAFGKAASASSSASTGSIEDVASIAKPKDFDEQSRRFEAAENPEIEDDPVGNVLRPVVNQKKAIAERTRGVDNTYAPESFKSTNEQVRLLKEQEEQVKSFELPTTTEAREALNTWVKRSVPDAPDVDELAPDQIREWLPKNNVTAELVLKQYKQDRDIKDAIKMSGETLEGTIANPRRIGRELIRINDGKLNTKLEEIEKGISFDGTDYGAGYKALMERTGLSAMQNFIAKNPNLPYAEELNEDIKGWQQDYKTRNYEETAASVKQKIGQHLYEKAGFGSTIYRGQIDADEVKEAFEELVKQGKLDDADKQVFNEYVLPIEKKNIGSDIPTSGFVNKLGEGAAKGMQGTINLFRSEDERRRDETDKAFDTRYTGVKAKNWYDPIADGMGDMAGQVGWMALTTKGIGGLSKLAGLSSLAKSEAAQLWLASFANTYDSHAKEALEVLPSDKDKTARKLHALFMTGMEAATEGLFRDTKVLDAFKKSVSPHLATFAKGIGSGYISKKAAQSQLRNILEENIAPFARNFSKEALNNAVEEAVIDPIGAIAHLVIADKDSKTGDVIAKTAETFGTTLLYSPVVAAAASMGGIKKTGIETSLLEVAANPQKYTRQIAERQSIDKGFPAQDIQTNLDVVSKVFKELEETKLTKKQKGKYLLQSVHESILKTKLEKTNDSVLADKLKEQIKASKETREKILQGNKDIEEEHAVSNSDEQSIQPQQKELETPSPVEVNEASLLVNDETKVIDDTGLTTESDLQQPSLKSEAADIVSQNASKSFEVEPSINEEKSINEPTEASQEEEVLSTSKTTNGRIDVAPIVGEAKKLDEIIARASKGLNQKIMHLNPSPRKRAIGSYNPSNKAVKIKFEGDLDTTSHEIGHALDDQHGLLAEIQKDPSAVAELDKFSSFGSTPSKGHPNPQKYVQGEGIAEWLRAYVVNPTEAIKQAPGIYAAYETTIPKEAKETIQEFSREVRTWAGATGRDMILSNVEIEGKKKSIVSLLHKDTGNFSTNWVDRLSANFINPLRAMEKAYNYAKGIKGVSEVLPENDPRILSRTLLGIDGKYGEILKSGMIDSKGEVITVDGKPMNLSWLLEPLNHTSEKAAKKGMEDVISFMVAERTVELGNRFNRDSILTGVGGGIYRDVEVAKKALTELEAHPNIENIKEAAGRYRKFSDAILAYLTDKGRLSDEQYAQITSSNLQYVALQRVLETEPGKAIEVFTKVPGKTLAGKSEPIKNIKGSTKKISNPYVSLMDTLFKSVREADRNEVLVAFRDMLVEGRGMYEGDVKRFSDIGVKGAQGDPNAITIFVDGKPEYWVFQDDVYKALKGLDGEVYKLPGLVTLPARVLRATVTNFPVFAVRNWIRDTQDRLIKSNSQRGLSGITNLVGNKEDWATVARFGGLNTGYYLKDKDSYYGLLKEAIGEMSKGKNIIADAVNFKTWYHKYFELLYNSETSNRVAEYRSAFQKAKRAGMDDYNASLKAAFESRDLIDFAVAGHVMKWLNQIIPFSNAAVQGMRSAVVKAKENPLGFMTRTILYSILPGAAMWFLNHRDEETAEEYEAMPAYQRDMFWNFKVSADTWLSVPKPYELSLFVGATDRLLSKQNGNENAFDGYGGTLIQSLMPMDEGAIAGPFRGLIEVISNKDYFRDKYIVPPHEEPLNLALRHTEGASRIALSLQKVSGKDARYIDHFIKAQFSYFGNMAQKVSNIGSDKARNKFEIMDLGLLKHTPGYSSQEVQAFLEYTKEWGLAQSQEYRYFISLSQAYFDEENSKVRDELAKNLRATATEILNGWKEQGMDKVKIARKEARD